jgi:hypothetical protein
MPVVTTLEEKDIAKFPPEVQAVVLSHPPNTCYRERVRKHGHYWIQSYVESVKRADGSPGPVGIDVIHGSDSFLPGLSVRAMAPADLYACDCGKWRSATDDQLYYMREHLSALELARSGRARPHGPDSAETYAVRVRLRELHRIGCLLVSTIDVQSVAHGIIGKVHVEKIEHAYNAFRMALAMYAPMLPPERAENEPPFIVCNDCHLKSHNPYDIAMRYCGACNKFHEGAEDCELGPAS